MPLLSSYLQNVQYGEQFSAIYTLSRDWPSNCTSIATRIPLFVYF